MYSDPDVPPVYRIRAATAALNVETPALQRVPQALELQAEPVEDLATLVHKRRARQTALEPPHRVIDGQVILLEPNGK